MVWSQDPSQTLIFEIDDFSNQPLVINGVSLTPTSSALHLVNNQEYYTASAQYPTSVPILDSWSTSFQFAVSCNSGQLAEGFAFVVTYLPRGFPSFHNPFSLSLSLSLSLSVR